MPKNVSITQKFEIIGQQTTIKGYLLMDEIDGNLTGFRVELSKEGSALRAMTHGFAVAVTKCLQNGVSLREIVDEFKDWRYEPFGVVAHSANVHECSSIMDYIVRELEASYLTSLES